MSDIEMIKALIAENEKLKDDLREEKDAKLGLSWAIGEINGENKALRKDAERFRFIQSDADSGMRRIYGDDWVAVIDAGGVQS